MSESASPGLGCARGSQIRHALLRAVGLRDRSRRRTAEGSPRDVDRRCSSPMLVDGCQVCSAPSDRVLVATSRSHPSSPAVYATSIPAVEHSDSSQADHNAVPDLPLSMHVCSTSAGQPEPLASAEACSATAREFWGHHMTPSLALQASVALPCKQQAAAAGRRSDGAQTVQRRQQHSPRGGAALASCFRTMCKFPVQLAEANTPQGIACVVAAGSVNRGLSAGSGREEGGVAAAVPAQTRHFAVRRESALGCFTVRLS